MASSFSNQCSRQSVRGAGGARGDVVAMAGYSFENEFSGRTGAVTTAKLEDEKGDLSGERDVGRRERKVSGRADCVKSGAGAPHSKLEVAAEFAEGGEDDEFADAGEDGLVFELPGVLMRDVDGVEADLHGGVDVAARAVADHPGGIFDDFVFVDEEIVGLGIFFADDFDELEESLEAGALDFGGLLGGLALGEKNQAGGLGEIGERFGNTVENFWRGAFEIDDAIVNLRERFALGFVLGELHVGFFERAAEAADTVAVLADIFALGFVEDVADVGARVAAGLDERDEVFD